MSRKKKITIIVVLVLIALLLLWLLLRRSPAPQVVPDTIAPVTTTPAAPQEPLPSQVREQEERVENAGLLAIAKTFAERFGSFSNEAFFSNVEDVMPLMTASNQEFWQDVIESAEPNPDFYTVTTRVISIEIEEQNEEAGTATVLISTQREEAFDNPQNVSVKFEDIRLKFEQVSGAWKVDSAEWLGA